MDLVILHFVLAALMSLKCILMQCNADCSVYFILHISGQSRYNPVERFWGYLSKSRTGVISYHGISSYNIYLFTRHDAAPVCAG